MKISLLLLALCLMVGCSNPSSWPARSLNARWIDTSRGSWVSRSLVCNDDGSILGTLNNYGDNDWFTDMRANGKGYTTDYLTKSYVSDAQAQAAMETFAGTHRECTATSGIEIDEYDTPDNVKVHP